MGEAEKVFLKHAPGTCESAWAKQLARDEAQYHEQHRQVKKTQLLMYSRS